MKTAMNELKERLLKIGFTDVEPFIEEYVEKEKQQIIDAHNEGQKTYSNVILLDKSKMYYNETFE